VHCADVIAQRQDTHAAGAWRDGPGRARSARPGLPWTPPDAEEPLSAADVSTAGLLPCLEQLDMTRAKPCGDTMKLLPMMFACLPSVALALSYDDFVAVKKLEQTAYELANSQDYQGALKSADAAWKLDPDKERNRYALEMSASCHTSLGDYAGAADVYKLLIDSYADPKDPRLCTTYLHYGHALTRLKKYDDALQAYTTELGIHADLEVKNNLAWVLATAPVLAHRDAALALRLAKEVVEESKENNAYYLDTYAAALAESERFDEAIEVQKKAIALIGQEKAFDYTMRTRLYGKKIKFRLDLTLDKALDLLRDDQEKL
jgi:tetratricopeptide (TPR) repeat protein